MFDHIGSPVSELARSCAFYTASLAPLGIGLVMEPPAGIGFGKEGKPRLWFGSNASPASGIHLTFAAANRAEGRAFYVAALAAGAIDNGAPGLRPHYPPNHNGAFVIDPDGHNIEAVCHNPED